MAPSPITVMPMYTPFYSPFGFSPLGFGGFMPINFNVLLIAGIAYVVYTSLKNRTGGSDFTGDGIESGSLGSGATVLKIQVALNSDWASSNNVMNTLSRLADKNSAMNGRNDLATLLNDASLALLRKHHPDREVESWATPCTERPVVRQRYHPERPMGSGWQI